jgi:hypothetical protein
LRHLPEGAAQFALEIGNFNAAGFEKQLLFGYLYLVLVCLSLRSDLKFLTERLAFG